MQAISDPASLTKIANLPAFVPYLRRALWVTWDPTIVEATGKPDKQPLRCRDGRPASTLNPLDRDTFDVAYTAAEMRAHGVGLVHCDIGDGRRLGGIDLDGCLIDGVLQPWAAEIVDHFKSYTEASIRNGVKIYVTFDPLLAEDKRGTTVKRADYLELGKDPAIECFFGKGGSYFACTGRQLGDYAEMRHIGAAEIAWLKQRMAAFKERTTLLKATLKIPNDDSVSWDSFNLVGMALWRATGGDDEGLAVFKLWSKGHPKYDPAACVERWEHYETSPPDKVGADTILRLAREGWDKKKKPERGPELSEEDGRSMADVLETLRTDPAWHDVLAFDRFTLFVMVRRPPPRTGPMPTVPWLVRPLEDTDITHALAWFHDRGMLGVTLVLLRHALLAVARENGYHPVFDYFDRIGAGAAPAMVPSAINQHLINPALGPGTALDLWLILGFGAEDTKLTRAIARTTVIGWVRRVRSPGCKQDYTPVLINEQEGTLKSSTLRALVGDAWFAEDLPDVGRLADAAMHTHGKIAIELAEIEKVTVREKRFLSKQVDRFRAPYGFAPADHPRTCSFIGTSNEPHFIEYASRGRRHPPVYTGDGDRDWMIANRDLVWRLACEAEAACEAAWISDAELDRELSLLQADAHQPDIWEDRVLAEANKIAHQWSKERPAPGLAVDSSFFEMVFPEAHMEQAGNAHAQRLTRILKQAGWQRGLGRIGRKRWFPPTTPAKRRTKILKIRASTPE